MRIIENNMPEYRIKCPGCGSILGFTKKDIKYNAEEWFGGTLCSHEYIKCAVCDESIILATDGASWYNKTEAGGYIYYERKKNW